jgi:hypothetical protein
MNAQNHIDMTDVQGLNVLTVHPGSMQGGLLCTYFCKHSCLQQPLLNPRYILAELLFAILFAILSSEQTSSLQVVLESSNDQDHADGNAECRCPDASGQLLVVIAMYFKGTKVHVDLYEHNTLIDEVCQELGPQFCRKCKKRRFNAWLLV